MFRRTSKHPEIFVRLDVRLNVLEFSNVYTYFLGRLDVNPKSFWFTQVVLKMMMMIKMMKMMVMDCIHDDDGDGDEECV